MPDSDERRWIEPRLLQLLGVEEIRPSEREELFAAWRTFFERVADLGPTILLFEDIHWYDEDTISIVNSLLRVNDNRLLVVVTGRSVPPLRGFIEELELKPLAAEDSEALIRELHPDMTPDARRAVQHRCGGVPLFIEQLIDGPAARVVL